MSVPSVQLRQDGTAGRSLSRTIVPLTAGLTYQNGPIALEMRGDTGWDQTKPTL